MRISSQDTLRVILVLRVLHFTEKIWSQIVVTYCVLNFDMLICFCRKFWRNSSRKCPSSTPSKSVGFSTAKPWCTKKNEWMVIYSDSCDSVSEFCAALKDALLHLCDYSIFNAFCLTGIYRLAAWCAQNCAARNLKLWKPLSCIAKVCVWVCLH